MATEQNNWRSPHRSYYFLIYSDELIIYSLEFDPWFFPQTRWHWKSRLAEHFFTAYSLKLIFFFFFFPDTISVSKSIAAQEPGKINKVSFTYKKFSRNISSQQRFQKQTLIGKGRISIPCESQSSSESSTVEPRALMMYYSSSSFSLRCVTGNTWNTSVGLPYVSNVNHWQQLSLRCVSSWILIQAGTVL